MRIFLTLTFCLALFSTGMAQESSSSSAKLAKDSNSSKVVEAAICKGECPVAAGLSALPELQFKVNGKMIDGCINCATAESKETGKPIVFVVGKKQYDSESKAKRELLVVTQKMVEDFSTPHTCNISKTTTIAGKKCSCPIEASNRAKLVKTALNQVKMNFKVGDKSCDCPIKAAELVKATGKVKEYVVGDTCTTCETTAKLELARGQYKAALEAIAKLEKKSVAVKK